MKAQLGFIIITTIIITTIITTITITTTHDTLSLATILGLLNIG